ncbi:CoA transferase [Agromyces silvae]|uniref:CoA transferase n=1 Tax=Agromyces silvae TaxID=3388266 RepID=UPI00280B3815|nr:CoA transferase [Agromyces protaetiae]
MTGSAEQIVHRVWAELGRDSAELAALDVLPVVPLPARLDVSGLAAGAVAAASLAAASFAGAAATMRDGQMIRLDGDRIATAFTSERWFRLGGKQPEVWAPLSGFRRAADGWVRTHANYPHHAAALRRGLGLAADADTGVVDAVIASRTAEDVEAAVVGAGGVCAVVRRETPADDVALRRTPLVELGASASGDRSPRVPDGRVDPEYPLRGMRVLDLTRVIAGPVGTRTLGLLGADVLRIDSPRLPEPEWQHLDTGAAKRTTLLDLTARGDRERFDELLARADAVVLGYRPRGMQALGLDPVELTARRPGLVVGQLAAWGYDEADAERRGFDSIVQAATGIAWVEGERQGERDAGGDGSGASSDVEGRPGALPAQALDHASGYLLAAAVISMLAGHAGEARIARVSLRRTAAELLGLPRTTSASPADRLTDERAAPHLVSFDTDGLEVRSTGPAISAVAGPHAWPSGPRPWGRDEPVWPE